VRSSHAAPGLDLRAGPPLQSGAHTGAAMDKKQTFSLWYVPSAFVVLVRRGVVADRLRAVAAP